MHIIDAHFHYWPRAVFERLCQRTGYPRAERNAKGGYTYWRKDGKELIFLSPDQQLMAVDVRENGASIALGVPRALFKINAVSGPEGPYTMSADAQHFIINRVSSEGSPEPVTLVTNWTAELKK